ncbi:MAG: hypothetical protein J6Q81_05860 [Lentisphaeria bacterium]|nr:hypothetical protein [Lentisphaeria bacterium]
MIVPMKKVLLITLSSDRDTSLEKLRELGVVEVVSENIADSADRAGMLNRLNDLDKALGVLSSHKVKNAVSENPLPENPAELAEFALKLFDEIDDLDKNLEVLRKEYAALEPWGEYDPAMIAELKSKNVYVYLCEGSAEQFKSLQEVLNDVAVKKISEIQGIVRFAVIADKAVTDVALPEILPAARSLSAINSDINSVYSEKAKAAEKLDLLALQLDVLKNYRNKLASDAELLTARDGITDCGELVALQGFVPENCAEKLRNAAQDNAWALSLSDPEPGETVPVLLEPPKWVKPILPLFQFLGIAPGYDEFDMSPGMLIFFSIFFSMIINDAGYAAVMLAGSIVAAIFLRKNPKAAMPCRLALVLSFCATAWGVCNGAYFGTETSFLQLKYFASGASQTAHLQLICFVLALVHLSLGHCWKLVNSNGVLDVIGQLGWVPILFLDFMVVLSLLVFPGMAIPTWALAIGGVGLAMVMIGGVDWRDVVAICNFPFDLIGSFTDTLSYVRLFAVGMSGTYMAQSFNGMGMQLWDISPWLIPVGIIVIVLGHLLNVALAFMSVLVHGVRLNTLEFSNHAGIRWGGQAYKPLKKFEQ